MATATQLMPSPTQGLKSAFSPYTDSPSSPAPFSAQFPGSNRSSGTNRSDSLYPPPSPYPAQIEPSPVDSAGTASTEIEDDSQDIVSEDSLSDFKSPMSDEIVSPDSQGSRRDALAKLDTSARPRSDSDEAPASVIHAPSGFKHFEDLKKSPPLRNLTSPAPTDTSQSTIIKPSTPEPSSLIEGNANNDFTQQLRSSVASMHSQRLSGAFTEPIDTTVPPAPSERLTPRAQTRQEAEQELKRRSRASSTLEDIPEAEDGLLKESDDADPNDIIGQSMDDVLREINHAEQEIEALQTALSECWTLCNTLAGLSSNHRERMFEYSGKGEVQEHAWRTCWKLCQKLYESRNEDHASQVKPTLELCRDFCQALFEVRQRGDELADSVLRVSFELNNHLYNTHDRNLPEPFRERTLDFYLTLCHRLMKQRTSLPEETDSLLRACWNLAEMLFSLRQNNRDNKPPDEELLGSAVQACWELCDLFREGWTQVRPDRGTPRPSVTTFAASNSVVSSRSASVSSHSSSSQYRPPRSVPETPTTIDDDREEMSPEDPVPNILVLGPEGGRTQTHARWSSNSSNLSTYSENSQRTSSTATAGREDPHLIRLKALIVRAAMNIGYSRNLPQTLPAFVKSLPSNSFGSAPWQMKLLESYRKLVIADPTLRTPAQVPQKRFNAAEVGRAVQWMGRSEQFGWLRDLYRLVFGFFPEDAVARKTVTIQT